MQTEIYSRRQKTHKTFKRVQPPNADGISPEKALDERFKACSSEKRVTSKVRFPSSHFPVKFLHHIAHKRFLQLSHDLTPERSFVRVSKKLLGRHGTANHAHSHLRKSQKTSRSQIEKAKEREKTRPYMTTTRKSLEHVTPIHPQGVECSGFQSDRLARLSFKRFQNSRRA
jgi:hypothetical protein